jgi:hypothetical protein
LAVDRSNGAATTAGRWHEHRFNRQGAKLAKDDIPGETVDARRRWLVALAWRWKRAR